MSAGADAQVPSGFAHFWRETHANVAMLFAMFTPVIVALLAIVVDVGAVSVQRRDMQAISDLAAILASSDPSRAEEIALSVFADNGHTDVQVVEGGIEVGNVDLDRPSKVWIEVLAGQYFPDPKKLPAERFVAGKEPFNAVKVTTAQPGHFFIMSGIVPPPVIETSGVAHATGEAAFSVGSRLLRIEGGVLNALLNSLIGSNLSLTAMDYESLLSSDISLFGTLDALATDVSLDAVTYDDVLDSQITVAQLAAAVRKSGPLQVGLSSALQKIASDPASSARTLRLRDAIDLGSAGRYGPETRDKVPEIEAESMEMLTAVLTAADGEHQVTLDLGVSVPGLLSTTVDLRIGERPQSSPWLRLSGPDKIVSTAQTRLKISTEVPGLALLAGTKVKLPIYVEAAAADAKLTRIDCPSSGVEKAVVRVAAQPAIGQVMIGHVSPARFARLGKTMDIKPAHLVDSKLIDISGKANVRVGNLDATELLFTYADIRQGKIKTATTKDYSASLVSSALGDLDLSIRTGPLSLGTPKLLTAALVASLTPALEPVDTIAFNLLSALGIHLGEADVRVHGVMCQRPVLVQ
jgi:uncharacterized membrane protein